MVRYCARGVTDDNLTVRELLRCQALDVLLSEARRRLAHLGNEELDLGPTGSRESSGYAKNPTAEAA
jgi:hypothetical protein